MFNPKSLTPKFFTFVVFTRIQGLVKGAILCFRNPYFYFCHGESTSTASQLASLASQKSKDLNKVLLLLQDLDLISHRLKWSNLNQSQEIKAKMRSFKTEYQALRHILPFI